MTTREARTRSPRGQTRRARWSLFPPSARDPAGAGRRDGASRAAGSRCGVVQHGSASLPRLATAGRCSWTATQCHRLRLRAGGKASAHLPGALPASAGPRCLRKERTVDAKGQISPRPFLTVSPQSEVCPVTRSALRGAGSGDAGFVYTVTN